MPPLRNLVILRKSRPLFAILVGVLLSPNIGLDNSIIANAQTPTPSLPNSSLPTIQITSVHDGQPVPPGELTIQGLSSDDEGTDCNIYADVNDISPMQNVTAIGPSGEDNDFSQWTFTYTQDYQLIKLGENELTAKISCFDDEQLNPSPFPPGAVAPASSSPLSEWHSVNVTGVTGATSIPLPLPLPLVGNTEDFVGGEFDGNIDNGNGGNNNSGSCDSSYPDVCIPRPPPRLNCADIPYNNVRVLPPDPHGLDGNDNDGIGCEDGSAGDLVGGEEDNEESNEEENDQPEEDSDGNDEDIEDNNDGNGNNDNEEDGNNGGGNSDGGGDGNNFFGGDSFFD